MRIVSMHLRMATFVVLMLLANTVAVSGDDSDCGSFSINLPKGFKVIKKSPVHDFDLVGIMQGADVYVTVYVGNHPSFEKKKNIDTKEVEESDLGAVQIISEWNGDRLLSKDMLIKLPNKEWPQFLHAFLGRKLTDQKLRLADRILASLKVKNPQAGEKR